MNHDEAWLDEIAAYAAGVLPAAEAGEVRAHLAQCERCRSEYASLSPIVDAMLIANAADPSPRLKSSVMREVRASAAPARRSFLAPYALAAACLAVAVASSLYAWNARSQTNRTSALLAAVTAPGTHAYAVPHGEVIRSGDALYLAVRGMPTPPAGKVYQAWTLPRGSTRMVPSVTFVPHGSLLLRLPVHADRIVAFAVSVEPAGGSRQPTSAPRFVVKFE